VARRYHACAAALAQTLGLSLQDVLTQHRESVTAIFIECGRCDLRLPAGILLPHVADAPVASTERHANVVHNVSDRHANVAHHVSESSPIDSNGHMPKLTVVPTDAGLPCSGQAISSLKPAQLAMLVSKVARLAEAKGGRWTVLLQALQTERSTRLERGKRPTVARVPPAEADADVP
jgi:hypothetical protein